MKYIMILPIVNATGFRVLLGDDILTETPTVEDAIWFVTGYTTALEDVI